MCGEHLAVRSPLRMDSGSSPHVRGAPGHQRRAGIADGIIPACAGSTSCGCSGYIALRDHPRMCGEHEVEEPVAGVLKGSSPHVRGARSWCRTSDVRRGIIPACAGSTRSPQSYPPRKRDHPRMCGEHDHFLFTFSRFLGSSPHVRGAPRRPRGLPCLRRIIPACAGSTLRK